MSWTLYGLPSHPYEAGSGTVYTTDETGLLADVPDVDLSDLIRAGLVVGANFSNALSHGNAPADGQALNFNGYTGEWGPDSRLYGSSAASGSNDNGSDVDIQAGNGDYYGDGGTVWAYGGNGGAYGNGGGFYAGGGNAGDFMYYNRHGGHVGLYGGPGFFGGRIKMYGGFGVIGGDVKLYGGYGVGYYGGSVHLGPGQGMGNSGYLYLHNLPSADPEETDSVWWQSGVLVQSGSTNVLSTLADVDVSSLMDGDVLTWNAMDSKWKNAALP